MERVIIVLCDTLRAKSIIHYGNTRDTTPRLNRIIDEDFTVYKKAYAPAPWTPPSHISLFTGLFPSQAMEQRDTVKLSPVFKALPELFKDSGYKTFAASANTLISRQNGFDRGFDTFLQLWLPDPLKDETPLVFQGKNRYAKLSNLLRRFLVKSTRSEVSRGVTELVYKKLRNVLNDATYSTDRAMKMLEKFLLENRGTKTFSFLNLMQAHNRYNPPRATRNTFVKYNSAFEEHYLKTPQLNHYAVKPFSKELIDYFLLRYEEEVLYLDIAISGLIGFLKRSGMYDDTAVIITSDHGEHFGENGHIAHTFSVFEPLLRIPLFIKWQGKSENRRGSDERLVMLQDLYSTFLSMLNHWNPAPFSSVDITSSEMRSWALSQRPDMSTSIKGCIERRKSFRIEDVGLEDDMLSAYIFDDGVKIIENGKNLWCFDLTNDRDEKKSYDISFDKKELIKKIKNSLD
ncbi:MAG: sulfatase-like hydrolase/transferase [Nitrospirae bacterium]|nr:sulfatase-like hydrolase/transferase [Nitrospirota bacterium]